MKPQALIAIVALAWLLCRPAMADMIPNSQFASGNWSGAAYDGDKRFSHCAMSTRYRNGISLFFSVSENWTWRIAWQHDAWRLSVGQQIPITLLIDGHAPRQLIAIAQKPNFAIAELPAQSDIFDQFRRGYMLVVVAEGQRYQFSLEGTYAALTRLGECVAASRTFGPPAASGPAPLPRATMEQRLEATKLVANIMAHAGVADFRILTDSEIKALDNNYLSSADVVWEAPGTVGVLRIIPKGARQNVDDIGAEILGSDGRVCKGTFASGFTTDQPYGSAKRLFTACETTLAAVVLRYTILAAPDGSFFVFATTGRKGQQADREAIDRAEAALRRGVYETIGR